MEAAIGKEMFVDLLVTLSTKSKPWGRRGPSKCPAAIN
jgi:hypothetical protein